MSEKEQKIFEGAAAEPLLTDDAIGEWIRAQQMSKGAAKTFYTFAQQYCHSVSDLEIARELRKDFGANFSNIEKLRDDGWSFEDIFQIYSAQKMFKDSIAEKQGKETAIKNTLPAGHVPTVHLIAHFARLFCSADLETLGEEISEAVTEMGRFMSFENSLWARERGALIKLCRYAEIHHISSWPAVVERFEKRAKQTEKGKADSEESEEDELDDQDEDERFTEEG